MLVMRFQNTKALEAFKAAQAAKEVKAEEANEFQQEVTRSLLEVLLLDGTGNVPKFGRGDKNPTKEVKGDDLMNHMRYTTKRMGKVIYSPFRKGTAQYLCDGGWFTEAQIQAMLTKDILAADGRKLPKPVKQHQAEKSAKERLSFIQARA